MNDNQANDIIENVMKAHWPNWVFKGQELFVWMKELRKFDYETAKEAINDLYIKWDSNRYPKMAHIMASIRGLCNARRQANKRLVALFVITRQNGTPRWFPFTGDVNTPREEVEKQAEDLRQEANRLYQGSQHIVHYLNTDEEEDTGYYGPDARDKAFADILNGPDSKTKRWLQVHLNRIDKKRKAETPHIDRKKEPVTVGEVTDDIPF